MKQTLEQAAEEWMHESDDDNGIPVTSWAWSDVIDAFKAGAERQKKQICKDCPNRGNTHSYLQGYEDGKKSNEQKKQDELTWEDIKRIIQIADSMLTGTAWDAVDYPDEQKYYEEVLKQYKEEKK